LRAYTRRLFEIVTKIIRYVIENYVIPYRVCDRSAGGYMATSEGFVTHSSFRRCKFLSVRRYEM